MRVRIFTHVSFDGPEFILEWTRDKGFDVDFTQFFKGVLPPLTNNLDVLVTMEESNRILSTIFDRFINGRG